MAERSSTELPPGFDSDGRPENAEAAQQAIDQIRFERGHVSARDLSELQKNDPTWRQDYLRRAAKLRDVYARFTTVVAETLYSSEFPLIHELLQNADDARYDGEPSIRFRITSGELIIETNECGFTLPNVHALCDTGKSSKVNDGTSTGEKGLGFKSVFTIANVVHIESGFWSFRFENHTEDGLGMVVPLWTETSNPSYKHNGTRIRLEYSDTEKSFLKKLISHFEDLPKSTIFSLRRLLQLEVVLENILGRNDSVVFHLTSDKARGRTQIQSTVVGTFGAHYSHIAYFREFEDTLKDLPAHKHRSSDETTVKVAFEFDGVAKPVIPEEGQHVFAFLPVQRIEKLPFLLHADFVLTASREAVSKLEWNRALRKGVAKCFARAVQNLCATNDSLAYQWMHFFPAGSMQKFWDPMKDEIAVALQSIPIMFSRTGSLRSISHVKSFPEWFIHEDEALVPDNSEDRYLSHRYATANVNKLRRSALGLDELSKDMIVDRIRIELSTGRIHKKPLDDPWHDTFVQALSTLRSDPIIRRRLDDLQIIPLECGRWVTWRSLLQKGVYLPNIIDEDTVQIRVPGGLDFQLLHTTACSIGERLAFYMSLGISACDPDLVIKRIQETHRKPKSRKHQDWIADLEILFWYDEPRTLLSPSRYSNKEPQGGFCACCDDNKVRRTSKIFFPSDDPCDAQSLLSTSPRAEYDAYGILSKFVVQSKMQNRIRSGRNWMTWLQERAISYRLPLTTAANEGAFGSSSRNNNGTLHPLLTLVAQNKSESFVDSLRKHWQDYQFESESVKEEIKTLSVSCMDNNTWHPLQETILPTAEIIAKSRVLGVEDKLPFLKLPRESRSLNIREWRFLEENFNVTCQVNRSFFLAALRALCDGDKLGRDLTGATTAIYRGLAETFQMKDAVELQATFNSELWIYVYSGDKFNWYQMEMCVWDGLSCLTTYQVLAPIYGQDQQVITFFKDLLKMKDASHHHLLGELKEMSSSDIAPARHKLVEIYAELANMSREQEPRDYINTKVDKHALIYGKNRWLTPKECLWNCAIEISGKEPLDEFYPELRTFFVEHLKVTPMTPDVLVKELDRLKKGRPTDYQDAQRLMLTLGQMLAAQSEIKLSDKSLATLETSEIFPATGPKGRRLVSLGDDFCINDHKRFGDLFLGKIDILDFSSEDLTSLHPLFELLDLDNNYLSFITEANTTVADFRRNDELTEHIRGLAYALSCCAIAHNSNEYFNKSTRMHDLLAKSEIYICGTMWTELTVGETTVRSERAVVRIDETNKCLKIYVPNDRERLYSCYCTELPVELANTLGIEDRGAIKIIYRIINDQIKDLDTIMRDEDLPQYQWLSKPSRPAQPLPLSIRNQTINSPQQNGRSSHEQDISDDEATVVVTQSSTERSQPQSSNIHIETELNGAATFQPPWQRVARSELYRKLLEAVIAQSPNRSDQSRDAFSLSQLGQVLSDIDAHIDYDELGREFSCIPPEERSWIGAAGELFIFRRLLALGVDGFSLNDWKSTVRRHVAMHTIEYANMAAWTGEEKADIMYRGRCPRLVQFLIDCSATEEYPLFLDRRLRRAVNFHLEVKATTGPCHVPFFLSQKQYRLMRDIACDPTNSKPPADLYVILRVYKLASSEIRVTAYINPWHLQEGLLEFMADPYRVTPISDGMR